jgi:23S rRNA (uridine2552-2'-O)-methyltransferase
MAGASLPPRGGRTLSDGKRRKESSRRWLERQLRDPYVAAAHKRGYRSRAAFKLIELDDRFRILRKGLRVVDLGAAPGGWTQVVCQRVGTAGLPAGARARGRVVAVDRTGMDAIPGADIVIGDAEEEDLAPRLTALLGGPADVVLSDMAPAASGHRGADHLRSIALAGCALDLALALLAPGGWFVCKVWQGGATPELLARLKRAFAAVRHAKPPASRPESPELYIVAGGFRSAPADA